MEKILIFSNFCQLLIIKWEQKKQPQSEVVLNAEVYFERIKIFFGEIQLLTT